MLEAIIPYAPLISAGFALMSAVAVLISTGFITWKPISESSVNPCVIRVLRYLSAVIRSRCEKKNFHNETRILHFLPIMHEFRSKNRSLICSSGMV